jgi:hypothetical protein
MEQKLNEHLLNAMQHLAWLRVEVQQLRRMGVNPMYQGPLRDMESYLELVAIILEHMGNNPAPLYFVNRTTEGPTLLQPTRNGPIPEVLRSIMMEDEDE